ncbi:MAG: hypothetical protein B6I19_07360 [Bacteroidetes bacterium 4572_114]|nr:MAG: hypothetical protein B6I19_07360 [Bacteroidetes bacterium 4572_114]
MEWYPGEAAADIFVSGRRLTKEDPVPLTKIQPVQAVYNGKPGSAAQKKNLFQTLIHSIFMFQPCGYLSNFYLGNV